MRGNVTIFRFDPTIDREPRYQSYSFDYQKDMTVLDVLGQIRDNQDASLGYVYCCRYKQCGICGMMINGKPALSCRHPAEEELMLEPLRNFPVLKDLMIDRDEYERLRPALRLFLEREQVAANQMEHIDMQVFEQFKIASRCIECYCCVSACPVYKNNPHAFAGPAALLLEARHFFDPRDSLSRDIILNSEGIDLCIKCGACSKVCGVGADPAGIIRQMTKI